MSVVSVLRPSLNSSTTINRGFTPITQTFRHLSTPAQDKPTDNTKLFVKALDSKLRGTVDPRDLKLLQDQSYMGPLSKQWSSLKSHISNLRDHDLRSKSLLLNHSTTLLPPVFLPPTSKSFTDSLPLNRPIPSHVQPIPGWEIGDEKKKEVDEIADKYFINVKGKWKETYGEVL
ncbi:hypothetical protein TrST_g7917 [Triparma strigata]|uniref:Uncharacterized protein n=1 Tax=Triparma strigata TaxID=1606541 RepID=A0A9W7AWP1_9STRA|nr:hypothetical protein TrST_g7917 [Triparma strigata]